MIYCIDSHNHVRTQLAGEKGYAFITPEQVEWYRRSSDAFTKANGGQPLPAVAFFHIPFPEYYLATSDPSVIMYGTRMEAPCSPKLNTGLFVNMRVKGDVMGVFAVTTTTTTSRPCIMASFWPMDASLAATPSITISPMARVS